MDNSNSTLEGSFASIKHAILITNLIIGITSILKKREAYKLMVTPESDVLYFDKDKIIQTKNADIVIWEYSRSEFDGMLKYPLLIIELTNRSFPQNINDTHNEDILKIKEYIHQIKSLKECCLYNYEDDEIIRIVKDGNTIYKPIMNNYQTHFMQIQLKRYLNYEFVWQ